MFSSPELYKTDIDRTAREQGFVYIEDLALSGVILALKRGGTSPLDDMDLGPFLRSIDTTQVEDLHAGISDTLSRIDKWWVKRGKSIDVPNFVGLTAFKDYGRRPCIIADELDLKKINASFVAGNKFDPDTLTGFMAFDPTGFEYSNESIGLAQKIIDSHRKDSRLFASLPV
jgi:hypothetical protein